MRAYGHEDDSLAGEWPIQGLGLCELQTLFGRSDEMYGSYPVTAVQAEALARATGHELDFERFDYFVDADATVEL